jgi:hypothetical protein
VFICLAFVDVMLSVAKAGVQATRLSETWSVVGDNVERSTWPVRILALITATSIGRSTQSRDPNVITKCRCLTARDIRQQFNWFCLRTLFSLMKGSHYMSCFLLLRDAIYWLRPALSDHCSHIAAASKSNIHHD